MLQTSVANDIYPFAVINGMDKFNKSRFQALLKPYF